MNFTNFTRTPKTPTHGRSRSTARTPLSPSLAAGLNSLNISNSSPTLTRKGVPAGDITNPFIVNSSKSRSSSPVKRVTAGSGLQVNAQLKRQASSGVIRKGGPESRLDVITLDYHAPRPEAKRSKSQSSLKRDKAFPREPSVPPSGNADRFISSRGDIDVGTGYQPAPSSADSSPGHIMRLAEATGIPLNKRILGFHEAPPPPSSDQAMATQRSIIRPLYSRTGTAGSTGATTNKSRKIRTVAERILDAPGMMDDYYINLLDWSCNNVVGVALAESAYIWRGDVGQVSHVTEASDGHWVTSLKFSNDGAFLAVGFSSGSIELWDVEGNRKLRTMNGHQAQVPSLSWHEHILSSGCHDGSIWHHDVRIANHKVMELLGHHGEVCGLQWRDDGELLASGGNDNVVNIWDARYGDVTPDTRAAAKWTKRNHTAAVKALAWCPWQPTLLASGGGTGDATVHFWNSTTGARLHSLKTPGQVTSVKFSPHRKEFMSTHGLPTNGIMVHAYPSMERIAEIRDAHDARVLYSALAPGGEMVATAAADENLKFWRLWEAPPKKKVEKPKVPMEESILSLR
ncbi:WD40 repeat-like protein [Sistotremastrum niveocremeum HHB9708]|uniref:WD40 repeat-like protein n=2 Tax=Sistotremastraceae TaxID=3402574 RepID=A0A164YC31_9AGAM|nr:WD40 repeat-like protein [Sistotremastrum niveocremeum HHB9708]KZT40199.1 WD40 repeat-like protein [Sistotremastrum suecicum HHB10207 ss-3]